MDCGAPIRANKRAKRCLDCYRKSRTINYSTCSECGKELKSYGKSKCRDCYRESVKRKPQCKVCGRACQRKNGVFCSKRCRELFKRRKTPNTAGLLAWIDRALIDFDGAVPKEAIVEAAASMGVAFYWAISLLSKKRGLATILNGDGFYMTRSGSRNKKWFMCVYGPAPQFDFDNMEGILKRHGNTETQNQVPKPGEYIADRGDNILYYLQPVR